MSIHEDIFKVLVSQHISEKSSILLEKKNTVVLKVGRYANKHEIKYSIQKLFDVKVKQVNTLIVKGKNKRNKNKITYGGKWKKAYVILHQGENTDFMGIHHK
ncbi:MAG: 50S ribosomal protein L23 [Buchnera aphidicola (Eriosoma harunire)]